MSPVPDKKAEKRGGGFSATKTKVARNCLKWIDLKSKNCPSSWVGGLFCHQNQSCSKLPEMDRSEVKKISLIWGGGLFCHQNQSCSKLPGMDRSEVKKFSLILGGGGGLFCHQNQSCSKLSEMDRSGQKISLILGGGPFLPPKPKLLEIA